MHINVLIEDPGLLQTVLGSDAVDIVYIAGERLRPDEYTEYTGKIHSAGKRAYMAFPYIFRGNALKDMEAHLEELLSAGWDGYLIRTLDQAGFVTEHGLDGEKVFDAGMYSWNTAAIGQMKSFGADIFTAPYELNSGELRGRGFEEITETVIYGYYPMMISANCLRLTTGGCVKNTHPYTDFALKDRKNAVMHAVNCCRYCYNIIYNSLPVWLADSDIRSARKRLNFTVEDPERAAEILRRISAGDTEPDVPFTRGHYKRGVE